jgi:simple sugar transport system permease protein
MSDTKSTKSDLDNSKKKFDVGSWLIPIIAVLVALFIGGILIKLQGFDPVVASNRKVIEASPVIVS